jgi:hypothetical protein
VDCIKSSLGFYEAIVFDDLMTALIFFSSSIGLEEGGFGCY